MHYKYMCFTNICFSYFDYSINLTINKIKLIISAILCSANIYCFYSIVYYFKPTSALMVFIFNNFLDIGLTLISKRNLFHIIMFIILTIFICFSFSIFLEIIEINLFKLNMNIRRNIIQREEDDE